MLPIIWTQCEGTAEIGQLVAQPWRVVESQHQVSTRKLVDSEAEHELLEQLIERAKPPLPADSEGLHYLLATPFRYPPLRHGSRFATRFERGVWYGAAARRTAFAEAAYYRLLFLEGTAADLAPLRLDLALFRARVKTSHGVDLTDAPFRELTATISSATNYDASQQLGREMRAAGVEACRYRSARDVRGGANFGVFAAAAFAAPRPSHPQAWYAVITPEMVEISKRDVFRRQLHRFPRSDFLVGGQLPSPGAATAAGPGS